MNKIFNKQNLILKNIKKINIKKNIIFIYLLIIKNNHNIKN